ncbi:adenylyl-sulfate kinase [Aquirufa ecclesiirivi]|uniref:adenylyl-sulfate kinase n=1 Tax=Aquirufa ecclesiirivi TaxID=2715124 RepID=UPI0023D8A2B3|nr:adenylyl-sulfate kinase [Aquirufa ecclesiirivi]MDF0692477.1 adenylyl-sulfate kinase [Aquirufa ecclesiirivi]
MKNNILEHYYKINRQDKNKLNGHLSKVIWFTGLSGSGKSTVSDRVQQILHESGTNTYILDGDKIRMGINKGLGFSEADRAENLRRVAEIAKLMADAGMVVLAAFISPLKKDRQMIREIIGQEDFIEVFVNTSLEICEERDIKGLYKKARNGEISEFTGITSPYENPENPDVELKDGNSIEESASLVIDYLKGKI